MTLTPGSRLGPYEIVAPIGAGGIAPAASRHRRQTSSVRARNCILSVSWSGGGLRNVRWGGFGSGKRRRIRVLYYWHSATDRLLMLFAFAKNESADLTPEQKRTLRQVIESEYP